MKQLALRKECKFLKFPSVYYGNDHLKLEDVEEVIKIQCIYYILLYICCWKL